MSGHPQYADISRVLITEEQIHKRIAELGKEIIADYAGKPLVAVGILKGAVVFFADLVRAVEMPVSIDFMAISSYGMSTTTTGTVRILKDLDIDVEGKHVLIVEDIIDTGLTLEYIVQNMKQRQVASVKVCALLDKQDTRKTPFAPDYCCFSVPNEFIVGYGLDYAQKYRNLRDVCVLKPEIYKGF